MHMKMAHSKILSSISIALLLAADASANTLDGLPGTLFSPSAQPLGHMGLAVSASAYGHQDGSMIKDGRFFFHETGKAGDPDTSLVQDLQSGSIHMNVALGLGKYVDLGLTVPYFGDFIGDTKAKDLSGAGLGDPSFTVKAGRALAGDHVFDAALLASVTVPSKNPTGFLAKQPGYVPTDSAPAAPRFFSSYGIGGLIQSLFTLDLSRLETKPPFRGSVNIGAAHSGLEGSAPHVLLGGGLEWMPIPSLEFFTNLQTQTRFSRVGTPGEIGKEYSFAAAGFSASGDDGIFFSVSVQKSLADRPYHAFTKAVPGGIMTYDARFQPSVAIAFNLGWTGSLVSVDSDHDGIPDKEDLCPNEPEDVDNFQDQDGCPDNDNDGDGIYDAVDKCPNVAEDKDGFEDQDGCPEPDNDKDGIPDLQDKCPNEPEDMDGFEDYDGCPDIDNDKDGIPDQQDKCPNQAEDKDGFEDQDGCPDPDNDQDKIPDVNDKCPNEPETYNGFEDGDGCPDQLHGVNPNLPPLEKRVQLRQVRFRGNSAEMMPESYMSLDTLAIRIKAIPDVMVEVRGYLDDAGAETETMRLSEERAASVRKYLVSQGVPPDQILARGMGSRDPIATNHTAAGRLQNRRIEVHRLN